MIEPKNLGPASRGASPNGREGVQSARVGQDALEKVVTRLPGRRPERTRSCPQPWQFPSEIASGNIAQLAEHGKNCRFCRHMLALDWAATRPDLGTLARLAANRWEPDWNTLSTYADPGMASGLRAVMRFSKGLLGWAEKEPEPVAWAWGIAENLAELRPEAKTRKRFRLQAGGLRTGLSAQLRETINGELVLKVSSPSPKDADRRICVEIISEDGLKHSQELILKERGDSAVAVSKLRTIGDQIPQWRTCVLWAGFLADSDPSEAGEVVGASPAAGRSGHDSPRTHEASAADSPNLPNRVTETTSRWFFVKSVPGLQFELLGSFASGEAPPPYFEVKTNIEGKPSVIVLAARHGELTAEVVSTDSALEGKHIQVELEGSNGAIVKSRTGLLARRPSNPSEFQGVVGFDDNSTSVLEKLGLGEGNAPLEIRGKLIDACDS